MKIPREGHCLFRILPVLLLLLSGAGAVAGEGGVGETIKKATAPFHDETAAHAVMPLPENTVRVETKYEEDGFRTETRKDKIERFQCSRCHDNKKNITINRAAQMAHGDIVLVHGGKDKPLSCYTCHDKAERDFLVTETGVKIDMDHSYQMCGQCHFRQKKDWAGGAHGKRVTFWAGERVIKNCTSCHDPHSPLFKKRFPVTYSRPDK
jgi:hypothetical protein